jgi:hypothetical protein
MPKPRPSINMSRISVVENSPANLNSLKKKFQNQNFDEKNPINNFHLDANEII